MKTLVTASAVRRQGSQRKRASLEGRRSSSRRHGSHVDWSRGRSGSQFDWSRGSSTFDSGATESKLDDDTLEILERLRRSQTSSVDGEIETESADGSATKKKSPHRRVSCSLYQKLEKQPFNRAQMRRRKRAKSIKKRQSLVQNFTFGIMGSNDENKVHPAARIFHFSPPPSSSWPSAPSFRFRHQNLVHRLHLRHSSSCY